MFLATSRVIPAAFAVMRLPGPGGTRAACAHGPAASIGIDSRSTLAMPGADTRRQAMKGLPACETNPAAAERGRRRVGRRLGERRSKPSALVGVPAPGRGSGRQHRPIRRCRHSRSVTESFAADGASLSCVSIRCRRDGRRPVVRAPACTDGGRRQGIPVERCGSREAGGASSRAAGIDRSPARARACESADRHASTWPSAR